MKRVAIGGDEWYPVYTIDTGKRISPWMESSGYYGVLEVSDDFLETYSSTMEAFEDLQDRLRDKYKEGGGK